MCIFCMICNNEIPSYKVYEDDDVLSFLDINQSTIGHTLVVPKKHYDNIFDLDESITNKIFVITKKIATAIKKTTNVQGVNILNNSGEVAGQSVNHFHIHIIPRYEKDDLTIKFSSNKLTDVQFIELKTTIQNELK